jgi:hypothetical protein
LVPGVFFEGYRHEDCHSRLLCGLVLIAAGIAYQIWHARNPSQPAFPMMAEREKAASEEARRKAEPAAKKVVTQLTAREKPEFAS